jgi:hypothetical protein
MSKKHPAERTYKVDIQELNRLRELHGLGWEELASAADIDSKTLRRWRNGAEAYQSNIRRVAKILECPPQRLLKGRSFGGLHLLGQAHNHFAVFIDNVEFAIKYPVHPLTLHKVLVTLNNAVAHTIPYTKQIKEGKPRDLAYETGIAEAWFEVAKALLPIHRSLEFDDPKDDNRLVWDTIANILTKCEFWMSPGLWTNSQMEETGIMLQPLVERIQGLLNAISKDHPEVCQ